MGVPWGIPHSLTNLPLPIPLPLSPGTAFINQPLYPALAILYPVPAIAVRTSNGSLMAAQIAAVSRLTSRTAVALKFKIISQINTFPPVAKCEFQSYHVRCSFVARSLLVPIVHMQLVPTVTVVPHSVPHSVLHSYKDRTFHITLDVSR